MTIGHDPPPNQARLAPRGLVGTAKRRGGDGQKRLGPVLSRELRDRGDTEFGDDGGHVLSGNRGRRSGRQPIDDT